MTMALEGGEGSASRTGRSLPPGKTWYPLYRRLGGPQGRSGQVRKISLTKGFDPRTVQPLASRYTVYAIRPTVITVLIHYGSSKYTRMILLFKVSVLHTDLVMNKMLETAVDINFFHSTKLILA
jgi:hypothetical protein